ncbi:hypothetical protein ACJX0J_014483 [Zea mays]
MIGTTESLDLTVRRCCIQGRKYELSIMGDLSSAHFEVLAMLAGHVIKSFELFEWTEQSEKTAKLHSTVDYRSNGQDMNTIFGHDAGGPFLWINLTEALDVI